MLPALQSEAPSALKEACASLLDLATPLLNAFAAAQTASGQASLEAEYAAARQNVLGTLLRNGMQWAEAGELYCCVGFKKRATFSLPSNQLAAGDEEGVDLLQSVETLAEAHRHDLHSLCRISHC